MSTALPDPDFLPTSTPAVQVYRVEAQSLEEIVSAPIRQCDVCGEEALFGCAGALKLGPRYLEICPECWALLRDGFVALP